MNTNWIKGAGETSKFAVRLELQEDPDNGKGALPEMAASWGTIQIWVKGRNLMSHTANGERQDSVHWYLWPILEWIVTNWNPLWHEERLFSPIRDPRLNPAQLVSKPPSFPDAISGKKNGFNELERLSEWWNRHSLLSCREGGIFPEIVFRRSRSKIEISWTESNLPGIPSDLRFDVPSGEAEFEPIEVAAPWWEVVTEAIKEIEKRCDSQKVRHLLKAAQTLDSGADQINKQRIAWMAGLGKNALENVKLWDRVSNRLGKQAKGFFDFEDEDMLPIVINGTCQASLLFSSFSPDIKEEDLMELAPKLLKTWRRNRPKTKLDDLATPCPIGDKNPWEAAAELADYFRTNIGWRNPRSPEIGISSLKNGDWK